jgi:primosomal protein N' (replication factor Y)
LYPPFTRLIHIEIKHKQVQKAEAAANWLHEKLLPSLGKQLLGPGTPGIEKMKNLYRRELLIKLSKHTDILKEIKALIRQYLVEMPTVKAFGQVLTDVDVDVY